MVFKGFWLVFLFCYFIGCFGMLCFFDFSVCLVGVILLLLVGFWLCKRKPVFVGMIILH